MGHAIHAPYHIAYYVQACLLVLHVIVIVHTINYLINLVVIVILQLITLLILLHWHVNTAKLLNAQHA